MEIKEYDRSKLEMMTWLLAPACWESTGSWLSCSEADRYKLERPLLWKYTALLDCPLRLRGWRLLLPTVARLSPFSTVYPYVSGRAKWLFVLSLDGQGQLLCRLAELPFQNILQLQFSYSEQMVLLGSDRVLYGVYYEGETGTLRPIFNHTQ